jgi:hypothetical protein
MGLLWAEMGSFWVRFFGANLVFDSAKWENWVRFVYFFSFTPLFSFAVPVALVGYP